jgi:hypothetical protein
MAQHVESSNLVTQGSRMVKYSIANILPLVQGILNTIALTSAKLCIIRLGGLAILGNLALPPVGADIATQIGHHALDCRCDTL